MLKQEKATATLFNQFGMPARRAKDGVGVGGISFITFETLEGYIGIQTSPLSSK